MFWSDIIIAHTVALAKATLYMKHKGKRKKERKKAALPTHEMSMIAQTISSCKPWWFDVCPGPFIAMSAPVQADPLKISPNQLLDLKGKCIHDNAHTHKCTDLVLAHDEMHTTNALYITPTHTYSYSSHRCPWYLCIQTECKQIGTPVHSLSLNIIFHKLPITLVFGVWSLDPF